MVEKDLGFVLRRYNFRETSLITTIYTAKFGKIRGILKGFYTPKKEFSSPLDIFSLNEFVFYPKKSEIWLISYTDLISDYSFLRSNLFKASIGAVFLNLINKTMQLWDKSYDVFCLLNNCLNLLKEENEFKILYIFLIKFLTLSGFKPELNHCINCRSLLGEEVSFSVLKGGLICKGCCNKVKDAQRISRQTSQSFFYIQKTDFPLVCRLNLGLRCQEEIFYIMREFLFYHFEFDIGAHTSLREQDMKLVSKTFG